MKTAYLPKAGLYIAFSAVLMGGALVPNGALAQAAGDACTLLSSDEIARSLGTQVGQPQAESAEEGTACRFSTASGAVVLRLWPTDARGFEEVRGTLDDSGAKFESAPGIGDAAYFLGDRIYARKGTQALSVLLEDPQNRSDPKRREIVTAVGE